MVVGDLVEVKGGDRIPADLRIISAHGCKVGAPEPSDLQTLDFIRALQRLTPRIKAESSNRIN